MTTDAPSPHPFPSRTGATVVPWGAGAPGWDAVASLWNRSARGRHAFFPWEAGGLAERVGGSRRFDPALALWALADGIPVGFVHGSRVLDTLFEPGAAVELLLVDPAYRRRGIGGLLLDAVLDAIARADEEAEARHQGWLDRWWRPPAPMFVDALGAWPYGPLYATLADGSERSGVFYGEEPELAACFAAKGFRMLRDSVVMQRPVGPRDGEKAPEAGEVLPDGTCFVLEERGPDQDFLDETFRGWRLWNHCLATARGELLSRAIFARMDGISDEGGEERYALFGVNTPSGHRRRGFAARNLDALLGEVARRGGRRVELHCYADNEPALALYRALGFRSVAHTRAMRRPLTRG